MTVSFDEWCSRAFLSVVDIPEVPSPDVLLGTFPVDSLAVLEILIAGEDFLGPMRDADPTLYPPAETVHDLYCFALFLSGDPTRMAR